MPFSLGATKYLGVKCYTATTYFQVVQKKENEREKKKYSLTEFSGLNTGFENISDYFIT